MSTQRDYQVPFKVVRLEVSKLRTNPCQGERRTGSARLRRLQESIVKIGCKLPPLVDSACVVMDGHRRVEALRALGVTHVTCLQLSEKLSAETLLSVNMPTLAFSSRDKLEAWAKFPANRTKTLASLDANCRRRITSLVEIFGADELTALVTEYPKLSPSLADTIREIRAAQFKYSEKESMTPADIVGRWALKFRFTNRWFEARRSMSKKRIDRLTRCILDVEELSLEDWYATR